MQVIEIGVKKGKKKRDIIVVSIDEEDFKNLDEQALFGEFHRGQIFVCRKEKEEELISILKEHA